jgi:hypothetical protein
MTTKINTVSGVPSTNRLVNPRTRDVGVQSIVFGLESEKTFEKSSPVATSATQVKTEQVSLESITAELEQLGMLESPSIETLNGSFVKLEFDFYN